MKYSEEAQAADMATLNGLDPKSQEYTDLANTIRQRIIRAEQRAEAEKARPKGDGSKDPLLDPDGFIGSAGAAYGPEWRQKDLAKLANLRPHSGDWDALLSAMRLRAAADSGTPAEDPRLHFLRGKALKKLEAKRTAPIIVRR